MSGTAKSKNRKTFSAVIATALALAIMLTGTLAWTSISQQALNEVQSGTGPNPGGRLHDDFDGENKDVYVENFGDVPIFARIRLDEYMEIGSGAGLKTGDAGYGEKTAQSLVSGADINDVTTWRTHLPGDYTLMGDSSDPFHDYWDWEFGGSTTYMPTFNKNKDSLEADINGTYDGTNPADDVHFDDYTTYVVGEQKTADAVYDADDNTIDEGAAAVEGVNITTVTETHTAASTLTGTVITMEAWKAMGSPVGPYWVYDVDGWAYWAQPIQPGTATGLLLDAILKTAALEALEEDWYYAINVIGQFATAGDIGSADDGTGFFGPDAGSAPTADAEDLLEKISGTTASDDEGDDEWDGISNQINAITPGSTDTVTIDGREWYVLVNDGDKALLWAKVMEPTFGTNGVGEFDGTTGVHGSGDNVWRDSSVREWLNGTYFNSVLTTLGDHVVETAITTRSEYNTTDWITTQDKVFLLSEADLNGNHNGATTSDSRDYTYGDSQLVTNNALKLCDTSNVDAVHYWLRSPGYNDAKVACGAAETGNINYSGYWAMDYLHGVRPALWVGLGG